MKCTKCGEEYEVIIDGSKVIWAHDLCPTCLRKWCDEYIKNMKKEKSNA